VVVPSAKVIVINVIAPHTLSARPLVVPETTQVTLRLDKEDAAAAVYVDGVMQTQVRCDETLDVILSPRPVRMILPETNNPYLPLSRKLRWGEAFTR
jgi:NAD+ kinase